MNKEIEKWTMQSLVRWEELVKELPDNHSARFPRGSWYFSYIIPGVCIESESLVHVVSEGRDAKTGWPPFWVPTRDAIRPKLIGNVLECWLGIEGFHDDAAHSDFWRVSSAGQAFLIRGYQEDGFDFDESYHGKVFDLTLPIWRFGEVLLQANKLAEVLGKSGQPVAFSISWRGLKGRKLRAIANQRRVIADVYECREDEVTFRNSFIAGDLDQNLTRIVSDGVRRLYSAFKLRNFDSHIFEDELSLMLANKYGNS